MSQTTQEYFRANTIIYFFVLGRQMVYGGVSIFLTKSYGLGYDNQDLSDLSVIAIPTFVILAFLASNIIFNKLKKKSIKKTNLTEKLNIYRAAIVARLAIIEIPVFFTAVSYLAFNNDIFLIIFMIVISSIILIFPTKARAVKDLNLDPCEENTIKDPHAFIM